MCELPKRASREFVPISRLVYTACSLVAIAGGVAAGRVWESKELAWALICLGGLFLVLAVVLPTVQQLEIGLPVGLRVVAAVQDRDTKLRAAFESQRGELELCAQLLCADPALAGQLLGAAWTQTTTDWRRPVGPALRLYAWCVFLRLIIESERLAVASSATGSSRTTPLDTLDFHARILVVLHSFANLTSEEISTLLGRGRETVEAELEAAEVVLKNSRERD